MGLFCKSGNTDFISGEHYWERFWEQGRKQINFGVYPPRTSASLTLGGACEKTRLQTS